MALFNSYVISAQNIAPFSWNKNAYGGTEYMADTFTKKVLPLLPKLENYDCFIMPGILPDFKIIEQGTKEIIVWMHNTIYQFPEEMINKFFTPTIMARIKYIVVVSEFQKKETLKHINIDESKVVVIYNAIEPLIYNSDKFDRPKKIKLVHTSTAERGLPILLNAITMMDEDFKLEVYNDFYPHFFPEYKPDHRIRFYGKTPKPTVLEAVEASHIHAYPSIYPETFCLSQAEAMSAGLLAVTSDIGSLSEVTKKYGRIYPYEEDQIKHAEIYAKHLTKAIEDVRNGNWNPEETVKFANSEYSWEKHKERWLELHDKL